MGSTVGPLPARSAMDRRLLSALLLALTLSQAAALFFGTPGNQCRSDRQCPTFARTQCLGTSFILCFGPSRHYTVSGRCLTRSNFFCDVGNVLGGRRNNCRYTACAECLLGSDCTGFDQYCSGNSCFTHDRDD